MSGSLGTWLRRDVPLEPAAVLGIGEVARPLALATGLLRRRGREMRAASGPGHLLVLGRKDDLPWVDGAIFLGWDHGMLASTTHRPPVHADLMGQALRQRLGPGELAVTPEQMIQYVASDGPVDIGWLHAFATDPSR